MKNSLIIFLMFLVNIPLFSQKSSYEYSGRLTPSVKKEKLTEAKFIGEIMPDFNRNFVLPYNERVLLNQQLDQRTFFERSVLTNNQKKTVYSLENYTTTLDYVSIEISATSNGKILTSQSTSEILTQEQKNIINTVDLGTNVNIKIKFKYKNQSNNSSNSAKIIVGEYIVTAVPQTEAEYPGGFRQISEYYNNHVFNQLTGKKTYAKVQNAIVKFRINEEGQIVDAEISRTSTDPKIDKLLLDATNKMPRWKPAENSKGVKVKQEFIIPFGGYGC